MQWSKDHEIIIIILIPEDISPFSSSDNIRQHFLWWDDYFNWNLFTYLAGYHRSLSCSFTERMSPNDCSLQVQSVILHSLTYYLLSIRESEFDSVSCKPDIFGKKSDINFILLYTISSFIQAFFDLKLKSRYSPNAEDVNCLLPMNSCLIRRSKLLERLCWI